VGASVGETKAPVKVGGDAPRHKVLALLDYDDTLFATREHVSEGSGAITTPLAKHTADAWRHHDAQVAALLLALHRTGAEVRIVTNAVTGWIEHTSVRMPRTRALLARLAIDAVSARGRREPTSTEAVIGWKEETFRPILRAIAPTHVLCIGDSFVEHEALRRAADELPSASCTFVWMHREPCICLLARQVARVRAAVPELVRPRPGAGDGDGAARVRHIVLAPAPASAPESASTPAVQLNRK
jgi:hypothetical protein